MGLESHYGSCRTAVRPAAGSVGPCASATGLPAESAAADCSNQKLYTRSTIVIRFSQTRIAQGLDSLGFAI